MDKVGFGRKLLFCAAVPCAKPHPAEEIRLLFSFPEKEAIEGLRRGGFEAAALALADCGMDKSESEAAATFEARLAFEQKAAQLMERIGQESRALAAYSSAWRFGSDLPDGDRLQDRALGIFEAGFWIEAKGIAPCAWGKLAQAEGICAQRLALGAGGSCRGGGRAGGGRRLDGQCRIVCGFMGSRVAKGGRHVPGGGGTDGFGAGRACGARKAGAGNLSAAASAARMF